MNIKLSRLSSNLLFRGKMQMVLTYVFPTDAANFFIWKELFIIITFPTLYLFIKFFVVVVVVFILCYRKINSIIIYYGSIKNKIIFSILKKSLNLFLYHELRRYLKNWKSKRSNIIGRSPTSFFYQSIYKFKGNFYIIGGRWVNA